MGDTRGSSACQPAALWRLRLLGGFELRAAAGITHLTPPMQHFVAAVALRRLTRAQTGRLLWPDVDESKAQARLRTTMWRLRKTCPGLLDTSTETMRLSGDLSIDVHDLAVGFSSGVFDRGQPGYQPQTSWELLPGWDEDWVIIERERCRQLCLHGLEQLARYFLSRGEHGAAVDAALAVVSEAPLHDSAHRLVIETHLAEGNVDEAIRAYTRYRALLSAELGLEPSEEIHELLVDHGLSSVVAQSPPNAGPPSRALLNLNGVAGGAH